MKIIESSDNINEILENDLSNEKLSFFYFTASWCGPCQRIFPLLLTLEDKYNKSIKEELSTSSSESSSDSDEEIQEEHKEKKVKEEIQEKIVFYKIDIDENEEYAHKCNIKSVPTFYLHKGLEKIGETNGADIKKIAKLIGENI